MVDQAIQMALLHGNIYHKLQEVFLKFEEGKLKGQKCREMKGATLQKALEGKFTPKVYHFKTFQGLQVYYVCANLSGCMCQCISGS